MDDVSIVAELDDEEKVFVEPDEYEEESTEKKRRKTSIGAKLVFIISTLIILSMGFMTGLVSMLVTRDTRQNAEYSNFTLNERTAADAESRINSIIVNVKLFYDFLNGTSQPADSELTDIVLDEDQADFVQTAKQKSINFFELNAQVAAIYFGSRNQVLVNNEFAVANGFSEDLFISYFDSEKDSVESAKNGLMKIQNPSPFFSNPMMSVFFLISKNEKEEVVAVVFNAENLAENISTGKVNETFVVNDKGIVLLHSDSSKMMNAEDLSSHPYVKKMINANYSSIQQKYKDYAGVEYHAVFKKITDANCYVITQIKTSTVLQAINDVTKLNISMTIAILSVAVLIIWIFSKTLSIPLRKLTAITDEINKGNFNTDLFNKLNTRRRDEIGVLNRSTKNERDILNTVTSLTNKGVTKAIVTKEIDFEPHLKDITIFFSDIRGFTAISDGFNKRFGEKSAAEIIGFLNDYMSRMVNCISITGGIVDKFEGDAVMAAWGVLRDDNLDFDKDVANPEEYNQRKARHQKHVKEDAISAIKATIAMRYALMKYNKDAELFTKAHEKEPLAKYKPHIRIGCGLNTGRATVGFMGSTEKMEFTSIGDAVNLASRTESSNKPCGTDILITQDTYDILYKDYIRCMDNSYILSEENKKDEIIVEQIPVTFEVKGKGKQHFYGVVNMPQFDIGEFFRTTDPDFITDPDCANCVGPNGPKTLAEVRKLLGIPTPDFESVNLDAEESKVKAQ
ncbi:MAG: adenylate/guanylate cyclase domain-containing protein [Treponema sp.]|nr:adenylate/guanylate cyclase domain-containing protein [Candidatus Treponema scatequi]